MNRKHIRVDKESLKKALECAKQSQRILQKEKNKFLKESKLKSQFVANMSHEIRTPLNSVIGLTNILLHTKINQEQKLYLGLLQKSGETLLHLINNILDFSKIEADEVNIDESRFDLDLLLEEIRDIFTLQIDSKKTKLKIEPFTHINKNLIGDSHRLKQILNNLISNAIKFTDKGKVIIRIEEKYFSKKGDKAKKNHPDLPVILKFNILDNGPGVPANKQKSIFEKYIQSDDTISKKFGGTGLGLAICKKLVENMGGKIGVSSPLYPKDSGKSGSLFWFELPFKIARKEEKTHIKSFKKYNAVIVDNSFPKPIGLYNSLKSLGIKIKLLKENEYELIKNSLAHDSILFLHAGLKVINSFQYVSTIRKEYPGIPMVIYSTVKMRGDTQKARLSGADIYLNLPIGTDNLKEHLQNMIGKCERETNSIVSDIKLPQKMKGKVRVLVVEDNEVNQLLVKTLLEKKGADVSLVSDGKQAIKKATAKEYDLIFMDISMPEMNGYQASKTLRKNGLRTPIIALTAHAFQETQEKCRAAGMNGFISKPYRDEDILKIFKKWIK